MLVSGSVYQADGEGKKREGIEQKFQIQSLRCKK